MRRVLVKKIIEIITLKIVPLVGIIFMYYGSHGQCYRVEGEELTFHASLATMETGWRTQYILTDHRGIILDTTSLQTFGQKPKGWYKIYSIQYAASSGVQNLKIGSDIAHVSGPCYDISAPFTALVCLAPGAPCQTEDGNYTFQSQGGNSNLKTTYILADTSLHIVALSDTTYFSNLGMGLYLIFPINYNQAENIAVGQKVSDIKGNCLDIGHPLFLKSCESCFVNAGNDIQLCASQNIMISAMGSGIGTYHWNNGMTGNTIKITPTESIILTVTYTSESGCEASDSLEITILGDFKADAGPDQTISCGEHTTITALGVRDASYIWSTGQITQSINVSPKQTTTYYVTVTNGDCESVDGVTVVVQTRNEPISGDTTLCSGQTTTLYACYGDRYQWSTGDTTSFINVNPPTTQTYTVTVTKSNGCISISSITVHVSVCGKIGDFVWEDINGNGTQESNEPGIGQVEIVLYRNGVPYETTYSDPSGMYFFTYLDPAIYIIRFKTPTGYVGTAPNVGSNDFIDSDVDTLTGWTPEYTVVAGYTNYTIDAGYYKKGTIGNLVWEDINKNGIQDIAEPGIRGIAVRLQGTDGLGEIVTKETVTDSMGQYIFTGLCPGSYKIIFLKPEAYTFSPAKTGTDVARDSDADPETGMTGTIVLESGEQNNGIDAGMYRCGKIGDYVWLDSGMEANVQDIGDVGIDGVVLELYKNTQPWNPIQSVVSYLNPLNNGSGYYEFKVCETGSYYIKVLLGNEYDFVRPDQEQTDTLDSDIVDIINGTTLSFDLGYAEIITRLDIGIQFKPLPITLLNFDGKRNVETSVNELEWSTSQEINNDYFKIKRSINGKAYQDLVEIQGKGTSASPTNYSYTDGDSANPGVYYYKLVQVDYDGKTKEYGPIRIQVGDIETLITNIYPNPTFNYSTLKIEAPVGTLISGSLMDMSGKRIRDIWINEVSRTESTEIILDTQDLKKGVYHIQLIINGTVKTLKWLVLE
jgi:hypothetical protein